MPYWQLYYHIVWATKNREPLLTAQVEPLILGYVHNKALDLEATIFALNGYLDHIHLVVSVPPKIALAKFIGQVKAVASVRFNQSGLSSVPFYWQEEYGVFSFDRKRLPNIVSYVERQKEHHSQATINPALEREITQPDDKSSGYHTTPDKSG
jgi:REP element-mobilizing transposase RayT